MNGVEIVANQVFPEFKLQSAEFQDFRFENILFIMILNPILDANIFNYFWLFELQKIKRQLWKALIKSVGVFKGPLSKIGLFQK